MAKKVKQIIKVQAPAGKAVPGQALGPVLGAAGINIMEFIKAFNEHTADMGDTIIPAVITVFEDRSWEFVTKTPPVPELIKKALKLEKGGASVKKQKIGKLSLEQLREIAELKMPDLNARNIEAAQEMVRGTARSMGVDVG